MARRRPRSLVARIARAVLPRGLLCRVLVVAGAVVVASVATVNAAVAFFGETRVNPLSPFHLEAKTHALGAYFEHRPVCFFKGDGDPSVEVRRAARRERIDPLLLEALIEVESQARCHRISPTGAMGPAQLMPRTARLLHVSDPFDARQGVGGGARYLKEQLVRYRGNVALAVAAYNAGPAAVHGRVPHNGETEFYVRRVLARWRELQRARAPRAREVTVRRAGRAR